MMLGSMLGDGYLRNTGKHSAFTSRHGWKQHAYNCRKFQVLSEFVRTPPRKVKNYGYGEWSSLWQTRQSEALQDIASLCLRDGKKRVTSEWLDRMTWEAVAWWYMDDGSLQLRTAVFNTQGFTSAEVKLLANWLTVRGVDAKAARITSRHNPTASYWIVRLSVDSTRTLAALIRPYVFPEMTYKLDLPAKAEALTCHWCSKAFVPATNGQRVYGTGEQKPCCRSSTCKAERHKELNETLMAKPGKRGEKNAKQREGYATDLDTRRKYEREKAARLYAKNREKRLAYKRAWRASKKSISSG